MRQALPDRLLNDADVAPHVDAMETIRSILNEFPAEERLPIAAGILGMVLSEVVTPRSKDVAIAALGPAMDMTLDMIDRNFSENGGSVQ